MEIAIVADDAKKELLTQFCIAYCGILSKHNICSTSVTGRLVADATGLEIERLLAGKQGGVQQILLSMSRSISFFACATFIIFPWQQILQRLK